MAAADVACNDLWEIFDNKREATLTILSLKTRKTSSDINMIT